ncbi:MAG: hypothetical protein ACYTKD_16235 [Planctomycetota bacterium]
MHHKRRRPKNRRAGCLLCKPYKMNGVARSSNDFEKFADRRRRRFAREAVEEELAGRAPDRRAPRPRDST